MNNAVEFYAAQIRAVYVYRRQIAPHAENPHAARLLAWYDAQIADARARLHAAYIARAAAIRERADALGLREWAGEGE